MKIIRASFFNTYPNPSTGQWIKIGLEAELTEFDDYRKCLYELKKNVNDFYYESTKSEEKKQNETNSIQNTNGKSQSTEEKIIEQIGQCSDKTVLKSFEMIAKKYPNVLSAYNNRLKNLETT